MLQGLQLDLTPTLTLTPTPTPTSTLTLTLTKVFSQTGEQKNLWNALKYSTAFPLVYAGYLRKTEAQQAQSAPARSKVPTRPPIAPEADPDPQGPASEPRRSALAA